jgi:triosephosphate isomerase (TIM)
VSDLRQDIEQLVRQALQAQAPELAGSSSATTVAATPTGVRPTASAPRYGQRVPLVAANWKMNQLSATARAFITELEAKDRQGVQTVICAPHILLPVLAAARRQPGLQLGAQNFHPEPAGAFTGEHSLAMLADAGVEAVIIGHSERRNLFGEQDALLARKLAFALAHGFLPIFCIGENLAERKDGATFRVLHNQLVTGLADLAPPFPEPDRIVFAYEPIWAIGTGLNATAEQAQEAAAFVRERLAEKFSYAWAQKVRVLYGGSANEKNAAQLAAKPDIDGFLVGNASLKVSTFSSIIEQTAACKRRP